MAHFSPENFQTCAIGMLLGRAAILKDRILDWHLESEGVTAAQFKVLIIVTQYQVDTPAELCRYLGLDSGSMTRMLDRLEQKGLILRNRCADDRRQVRLELTAGGQTLADQLPQIGASAMNELVGVLAADELHTLERILTKVLLGAGDAVVAQRLVRQFCNECRKTEVASPEQVDELVRDYLRAFPDDLRPNAEAVKAEWVAQHGRNGQLQHFHAPGCSHCDNTGFKGRMGVHELMVNGPELRRLIQSHSRPEALQHEAMRHSHFRTLRQDGIEKVLAGLTSIDEVRANCN